MYYLLHNKTACAFTRAYRKEPAQEAVRLCCAALRGVDGEAGWEDDGTVLMAVKIGSELGTSVSSIKKIVLVTEVNEQIWARSHPYPQTGCAPPEDPYLPSVCGVML